jgi:hypothetical protein
MEKKITASEFKNLSSNDQDEYFKKQQKTKQQIKAMTSTQKKIHTQHRQMMNNQIRRRDPNFQISKKVSSTNNRKKPKLESTTTFSNDKVLSIGSEVVDVQHHLTKDFITMNEVPLDTSDSTVISQEFAIQTLGFSLQQLSEVNKFITIEGPHPGDDTEKLKLVQIVVRIRNHVIELEAAVCGRDPILLGTDVIQFLFGKGYVIGKM